MLGIAAATIHYTYKPTFQIKVTQENPYSANVDVRTKHYPAITRITNQNMECLKRKGYRISETHDKNMYSNWYIIARLEVIDSSNRYIQKHSPLPAEKLIANCKEYDVHTEIIYKYDNEFGNEVQEQKNSIGINVM